jgi:hypothetical protein
LEGPRYSTKQLKAFRTISKCEKCVHYMGCPLYMTILLLNHERCGPFQRMMLPDIEKPCIMFAKHPIYWNLTGEDLKDKKRGRADQI